MPHRHRASRGTNFSGMYGTPTAECRKGADVRNGDPAGVKRDPGDSAAVLWEARESKSCDRAT